MKIKAIYVMTMILILCFVAACSSESNTSESETNTQEETNNNEKEGLNEVGEASGEMRVAVHAQPPTLDSHITTATISSFIMRNVYETLVTMNSKFQPTPMLAESIEKSEDGKTYTFKLREGVKFHNGNEMTADDVVASMNRWVEVANVGLTDMATFEKVDDYTVDMILVEPKIDVLDIIADPSLLSAIMPKEVIDNADSTGVTEYIGTGPYKFEDWAQDQYIKVTAFEDYQSIDLPSDGLSGERNALVKDIYFEFVLDVSTRISGIQTEEYDVITNAPYDSYEQLKSADNLETYTFEYGNLWLVYNKKQGPFSNQKMRHAVNAALELDSVMKAAFANEDFYELDPGYMSKNSENWYSDGGKDVYNQNDAEKAKALLEEAGYNGETVRILTTRDYERHYNAAVVIKEQLDQIGMNVELEVYDWPTLLERRDDPANWELHSGSGSFSTTPTKSVLLNPDWAGWTDDEHLWTSLEELNVSKTQEEAKQKWDEIESYLWTEYLPTTILGTFDEIVVTTKKVEGFSDFLGGVFWNTSVNK